MLSRVADRIYWMSRYMERAENMARILGVTSNVVLCSTPETQQQNLLAPLTITDTDARRTSSATTSSRCPALIDFMALDEKNPSCIYTCLQVRARERARGALADHLRDVGDAQRHLARDAAHSDASTSPAPARRSFFDWVKERSHLFRGVTYGTIMRGEAFNFSRLGTFLERADNTARILDVKYHILLPRVEDVGGALDYYQWAALLRSVSALRDLPHDLPRPDLPDQGGASC